MKQSQIHPFSHNRYYFKYSSYSSMSSLKLNPLTSEEKDIIIDKGTEYPGTGEYLSEKRA